MPELRWFSLTDADRKRLAEGVSSVLGEHPWVAAGWIFGSVARGTPRVRDVDVGVLVRGEVPWDARLTLANEFRKRTGIAEIEFDVRLLNGGDPPFLNSVLTDGQRVYDADPQRRIEFETYAMAQWLDFKPVWERMRRAALERWSRHG